MQEYCNEITSQHTQGPLRKKKSFRKNLDSKSNSQEEIKRAKRVTTEVNIKDSINAILAYNFFSS